MARLSRSFHGFFLLAMAAAGCAAETDPAENTREDESALQTPEMTGAPGSVSSNAGGKFRRAPKAIPEQYIVVLADPDPGSASQGVEAMAKGLAAAYGGTLLHTYEHALRGFAVRMSETQAKALAAHPAIDYVIEDAEATLVATTQSNATWGQDRVDQRSLPLNQTYTYEADGTGVHAYIIDSGIRTTHVEFGGRASLDYDAINDGSNDCNGHGTHVAGTVGGSTSGIAKNVRLHGVRVLDCGGWAPESRVIAGVDWVTANHQKPAVVNMSLGYPYPYAPLEAAVSNSIQKGITYVVAAGNSNADACEWTPARVDEAITVGATDATDTRAGFSNWGLCLDLFAPGVNITSAYNTSNTAMWNMNGTSMATPHVAGMVALYLQSKPLASPASVASVLLARSTKDAVINPAWSSNRLLRDIRVGSFDYDRDRSTDMTFWRPSNGVWGIKPVTGGAAWTKQWGLTGDKPVAGDYDGDGKADTAVFRPSNSTWYVVESSTGASWSTPWGQSGDIPAPGDYDGDGTTDIAVFRPSNGTWYVIDSSTWTSWSTQYGQNGDVPVPRDYDGDGDTDIAVWRPSNGTWYVINSSTWSVWSQQWGLNGDTPTLGDYDRDGRSDVAVFRPSNGTWYVINSSTWGWWSQQWGQNGDVPIPGDYDRDGRTDVAVYRPSSATWHVIESSTWGTWWTTWGLNGDVPVNGLIK